MDGMNRKKVIHWVGCVWVLLVSLGFSSGAQGATFCVSDGTGLQAALTQAASNGEDDLIKIQEGSYFGNFVYASKEGYGVTVEGGYLPGCASRVVDPAKTILDGNQTRNVLAFASTQPVSFVVDGLTLQNGAAVADGGGCSPRQKVGDSWYRTAL